tara:strand:+ start:1775 stop:2161 length:387 start_codon:yes stop_codon:yes gene_type:complete
MKRAVKFSERLFTKGGLLKTEPIANSIQKDIVMSLRQKKINDLKKARRSSVLGAFLLALLFFPLSGFAISVGVGFAWFLFCVLLMLPTGGLAGFALWPTSMIIVPWHAHTENKKRDLEIDLQYGDRID